MRITIIFLLALIAGTVSAQQPIIDSMLIDESKGILSVHGSFGSTQGKVWCDSVELPVLSWSPLLVTATIPDTGKGSAGGVVVESNGENSKERLISLWKGRIYNFRRQSGSIGEDQGHGIIFNIRMDLTTVLVNENKHVSTRLTNNSRYNNYYDGGTQFSPTYGYNVTFSVNDTVQVQNDSSDYTRGVQAIPWLYTDQRKFELYLSNIKGLIGTRTGEFRNPDSAYTAKYIVNISKYSFSIPLDSEYKVVSFTKTTGDIQIDFYFLEEEVNGGQFFLPVKVISLKFNPSIIAPNNNRTNLGTDDILLKWDTLKYMDGYHIQLSKDSLINSQRSSQQQQAVTYIVDTTVSSLEFQLPHLEKNTKYYWRVCGVNTEGESRWSDVWSFTTGTSADVRTEKGDISFSCYPNPAWSEMTITSPSPSSFTISNTAGQEIRKGLTQVGETKIDVSALPTGVYFVRVSGEKQAKMIQILR